MKIKRFKEFKKVLIIHGFGVTSQSCFYPWLKYELESKGFNVELPELPEPEDPLVEEQVQYILKNYPSQKHIIICHSFGGCVGMKLIESLDYEVESLYLVSCFGDNNFHEGDADIEKLEHTTDWIFNYEDIKSKCQNIHVLNPSIETFVTDAQMNDLASNLGTSVESFEVVENHATGKEEPGLLNIIIQNEN